MNVDNGLSTPYADRMNYELVETMDYSEALGCLRGKIRVSGLEGWTVTAELYHDGLSPRLRGLSFWADNLRLSVDANVLRAVSPRSIIELMTDERATANYVDGEATKPAAPDRSSRSSTGRRFVRDASYLLELAELMLKMEAKGTRGKRRLLAEVLDRTESQIRDDLTAAERKGLLMRADATKQGWIEGPNLAELRSVVATSNRNMEVAK